MNFVTIFRYISVCTFNKVRKNEVSFNVLLDVGGPTMIVTVYFYCTLLTVLIPVSSDYRFTFSVTWSGRPRLVVAGDSCLSSNSFR